MPIMVILRGVPGSGKSTLAKKLAKKHDAAIFSTDDRFIGEDGIYRFDPSMLVEHHKTTQRLVRSFMYLSGKSVIIDNTNIKKEHITPYYDMAVEFEYEIEFITCHGKYDNSHNVPKHIVERMRREFEECEPSDFE